MHIIGSGGEAWHASRRSLDISFLTESDELMSTPAARRARSPSSSPRDAAERNSFSSSGAVATQSAAISRRPNCCPASVASAALGFWSL